ncbi:hypothetical protein LMG22037_04702 [Paraburkholderia phenoliruptrix]|uniref:Uncharacterized protein n=1 Tax=Paraburkholderia phenoliruptrix TaxID=252970 RepID=A0A6J5BZG7_9BURK|nr:hypothetical protein [Paraburkholderia phenoliruptrix]CAB3720242.1 hypothetical protein LMG22037_04702 [Paraburkholderia phenoliruptrix]
MNSYAIVENGVVSNVILWDGQTEWTPPPGSTVMKLADGIECGPGYTFDGTNFIAPPAPPPQIF